MNGSMKKGMRNYIATFLMLSMSIKRENGGQQGSRFSEDHESLDGGVIRIALAKWGCLLIQGGTRLAIRRKGIRGGAADSGGSRPVGHPSFFHRQVRPTFGGQEREEKRNRHDDEARRVTAQKNERRAVVPAQEVVRQADSKTGLRHVHRAGLFHDQACSADKSGLGGRPERLRLVPWGTRGG